MSVHLISIVGIGAYFLSVTAIGLLGSRSARDSDMFNIFGRRAGSIRATAGYLGLIGGGELITITQLGYENGWDVLWFLSGIVIGFFVLASAAGRIKTVTDRQRINTLTGYYTEVYGPWAGYAGTVISVLSLGSLLTIQFIVGSELLNQLIDLPHNISIFIIGAVILSYLLPAGIVAVLSTDVLRVIMMSVVLCIIVGFVSTHIPGSRQTPPPFTPLGLPDNAIYVVLGLFGAIAAADVWQTIIASRNLRVVRRSLISAVGMFMAVALLLAALGMYTRLAIPTLPAATPAFVAAATRVIPGVLSPLLAVLIVGSIMATADTEIWVISTVLLSNIKPSFHHSKLPNEGLITTPGELKKATQVVMPFVAILATCAAYLSGNAQAIYTGLLSLLTSSGVVVLGILLLAPARAAVTFSLWSGIISYLALSILFSFDIPVSLTLLPVGMSLLAYITGSVWASIRVPSTRANSEEQASTHDRPQS